MVTMISQVKNQLYLYASGRSTALPPAPRPQLKLSIPVLSKLYTNASLAATTRSILLLPIQLGEPYFARDSPTNLTFAVGLDPSQSMVPLSGIFLWVGIFFLDVLFALHGTCFLELDVHIFITCAGPPDHIMASPELTLRVYESDAVNLLPSRTFVSHQFFQTC